MPKSSKAPLQLPAVSTSKVAAKSRVKAVAPAKTAVAGAPVAPEQRRNYIEVAAYYIAERHGFAPGREAADWAEAEALIDRLLAEGSINS